MLSNAITHFKAIKEPFFGPVYNQTEWARIDAAFEKQEGVNCTPQTVTCSVMHYNHWYGIEYYKPRTRIDLKDYVLLVDAAAAKRLFKFESRVLAKLPPQIEPVSQDNHTQAGEWDDYRATWAEMKNVRRLNGRQKDGTVTEATAIPNIKPTHALFEDECAYVKISGKLKKFALGDLTGTSVYKDVVIRKPWGHDFVKMDLSTFELFFQAQRPRENATVLPFAPKA